MQDTFACALGLKPLGQTRVQRYDILKNPFKNAANHAQCPDNTNTTQPIIYHRSHHIHPLLKKTGTCLLKAPTILLYYFVSIKSLLSTTLQIISFCFGRNMSIYIYILYNIQDTLLSRARAKVSYIQYIYKLNMHI